MSRYGAILQDHNNELVKCIEDLRTRLQHVDEELQQNEVEKQQLEKEYKELTVRLEHMDNHIAQQHQTRQHYQRMLDEAEQAYTKIIESSQTLLKVLKKESN